MAVQLTLWLALALLLDLLLLRLWRDQRRLTRAMKAVRNQMPAFEKNLPPCGQLSDWLADREQQYPGMRPGNATSIIWAGEPKPAPLVVLYLHGFSASPLELSPVVEQFADALGAHFIAPRLSGHGLDSAALGAARAEDWIADTWQVWTMATAMGARVVIVASSTGATLATQLLRDKAVRKRVAAVLFVSPNYGVTRPFSALLNWPMGVQVVKWKTGSHWEWRPESAEQARLWTYRYPISALHEVQRLVFLVTRQWPRKITVPLCVFYCEQDKTVSAVKTKRFLSRWPTPIQWFELSAKEHNNNHVLAGDAVRPENNAQVLAKMTDFVTGLDLG